MYSIFENAMNIFPFANDLLALYLQATVSLTWERTEELSDNSGSRYALDLAHTSWWEQVVEILGVLQASC